VVKRGVGLERELVARQVARPEGEGGVEVAQRGSKGLPWQGVHQVDVHPLEVCECDLDRTPRGVAVMNAAELGELVVVETLHADRQAIDAGGAVVAKARGLESAGVGLDRGWPRA